jgi:hypothetical protein
MNLSPGPSELLFPDRGNTPPSKGCHPGRTHDIAPVEDTDSLGSGRFEPGSVACISDSPDGDGRGAGVRGSRLRAQAYGTGQTPPSTAGALQRLAGREVGCHGLAPEQLATLRVAEGEHAGFAALVLQGFQPLGNGSLLSLRRPRRRASDQQAAQQVEAAGIEAAPAAAFASLSVSETG